MPPSWPVTVVALKPLACGAVLWRMGGVHRITVVAKATFGLVHEGPARLLPPDDLVSEDRVRDPVTGALDEASDLAPYLPSAGVLLAGHAHAPGGRPAPVMAVRLSLYREQRPLLDRTLHVFGYRPPVPGASPQPFQKIPLRWERAYGGAGVEDNPAGSGAALPNVVDPGDATRPAGFGPIARGWGPRRRLLGGADAAALGKPVPELPEGCDFRWFHAAPVEQQIELLRGDEWIVMEGMHPSLARVSTRLPGARAEARLDVPGAPRRPLEMLADTLLIDADRQVCSVVWRGHFVVEAAIAELLPLVRVFAGLELPGHPMVWPEATVAALAPAPPAGSRPAQKTADVEPPTNPATTTPLVETPLPRFDDDDGVEGTTRAVSLVGVPMPVLPFRPPLPPPAAPPAPPAGAPPHPATPPPVAAAAASPLPPPVAPSAPIVAPPIAAPPTLDDDHTSAVDLRQAQARLIAPFALTEPGVRVPVPAIPLPGAPWSLPLEPALPALFEVELTTTSEVTIPLDVDATAVDAGFLAEETVSATGLRERVVAALAAGEGLRDLDLRGADLHGLDLRRAGLGGARLRGANLRGCDLEEARLDGADLAGADLGGASLVRAHFSRADFSGAVLDGARLDGAEGEATIFDGARLVDARAEGATLLRCSFLRVEARGSVWEQATLDDARFDEAVLDEATLLGASCARASFARARAENANLERLGGEGADLTGARLEGANLRQARLADATLTDADLRGVTANRVDLSRARLTRADLGNAVLRAGKLPGAMLAHANLEGADLRDADLERANLFGARRVTAKLNGASLKDVVEIDPEA